MPTGESLTRTASMDPPTPPRQAGPKNTSYMARRKYSRRRLLIITWEDHDHDDQALEEEMQDLEDFYGQYLKFEEVERWHIPKRRIRQGLWLQDDSHHRTRERVRNFRSKYGGQGYEHLVIYYGGHGKMRQSKLQGRGPYLEVASGGEGDQSFKFNSAVLDYTCRSNKDCTIILDACDAGASTMEYQRPANETIAACSNDQVTNNPGSTSFTRRLLRSGCFTRPFTTKQWFDAVREVSMEEKEVAPWWHSYEDGREVWYEPAPWATAFEGKRCPKYLRSILEERLSKALQDRASLQLRLQEAERIAQTTQQKLLDAQKWESICVYKAGLPPGFAMDWLDRDREISLRHYLISSGTGMILGLSDEEAPSETDIQSMVEDPLLTNPCDPNELYAAYRRIKDLEIRNKIFKMWVDE